MIAGLAVEEETNQTPTWKKEETSPVHAPPQVSRKISRTSSIPLAQPSDQSIMDLGDLMESSDLAELSNQVPLEKIASPAELQRRDSGDEDSWDKLYNETGDLLRPDALEEVNLHSFYQTTFKTNQIFKIFPSDPVDSSSRISANYATVK